MRPLKLTLQAFGPYAKKETIDFSQLGTRTMFVISGKTGSGKTTIFDGISYAIYGNASGEDRNGPELRSQFADNDTLTELTLEFSLRGKTYIVKRSPQQEKKKARGDGTTSIGAKAELYVYDDDGKQVLLAANVRDVNERIKEIMIIDSNQFRQILMIPQGEFRKLLVSDSKDKEAILQRLFSTHLYKRIEEKLKDEAKALEIIIQKQVEQRNQVIKKIQAHYQEELKQLMEVGSTNDVVIVPLLIEEIKQMELQWQHLVHELEQADKQKEVEQKKYYEAEKLLEQFRAKEDAKSRLDHLEAETGIYNDKQRMLDAGKRALTLVQQEELCTRLKNEITRFTMEMDSLAKAQLDMNQKVTQLEEQLQHEKARDGERKQLEEQIHFLQSIKEDIESFATLEKTLTDLLHKQEKEEQLKLNAEQQLQLAEHQRKDWVDTKNLLETNHRVYLENQTKLALLKQKVDVLAKVEQHASQLKQAERGFEHIQTEFNHQNRVYEDRKATVEYLENQWVHGQAILLASHLVDGQHCPVCGSTTHPAPASQVSSNQVPTEAERKAAKRELEEAERLKRALETKVYQQQAIVEKEQALLQDAMRMILAESPTFQMANLSLQQQELAETYHQLKRTQDQLEKEWSGYNGLLTRLTTLEQKIETDTSEYQQLLEQMTTTKLLVTEHRTLLAQKTDRIPESLRQVSAYLQTYQESEAKLARLMEELERAQQLLAKAQIEQSNLTGQLKNIKLQKDRKELELATEREVFKAKLAEQGFATYNEYAEARRTELELREIEASIANYRESLRSARDRYAELEELLKETAVPELEGIKQEIVRLSVLYSKLDEEKNSLFYKKRENEQILTAIHQYNQSVKDNEKKYQVIGNLADISKGNNHLRISFERYVLASFLDDILEVANARLLKMTSGRYQLARKTDRSKGSAQSGLELLIEDAYTGGERHVKTLSGGESFKASLALALGLADIVQQHAGGVSLETMFIDEGFGTLDPESLDQAIEALIDIQSSGRLVGIISHVPELKERIDAHLEVSASQTGSTTSFHFMN